MLLLVTIVLVLVAAVTLLIGIFSDNLALIFISIGASALAAIVLGVLSQVSKRKGREAATSAGPEPLPAREPATVGGGRAAEGEQAAADIAGLGEPVSAAPDAPTTSMAAVGSGGLPIANYDSLRVNEILPALGGLDLDQLEAVAQHEESNKNRTTVLNRIDDLMDQLEADEGAEPAVVDLTDDDDDDVAAAAVESIDTLGEPVVAVASGTEAPEGAADGFPIADFDDLDEDELIERLNDLDADELEAVADREEASQNRDAVLDAIDDRLDILEGIVPAPPAKAAAATKATSRSEAATTEAKKTPARKAPAKKVSAPTPTRPAATRKAASTPVKKAASAKKAAAPAKKTAAKRAAAPVRKTATKATPSRTAAKAPARKASSTVAKTTKKATTAKKATAAKKAVKKTTKKATKR